MDRKHSEELQSRVARTVNSAACFSAAYVILTYILWFVTGLTARIYKFDSFVYYYGVKFILNNHGWTKFRVALIYSSGPVFILFLALLALFLYNRMKDIRSILNVFFLWIFVVGMGLFISQIIIAILGMYNYNSIYYQSLAISFSWLKVPHFMVYLMGLLVFVFVIYIGANTARPFLVFSFSYSKVNNLKRRRKYFFETALAPFVVGAAVTVGAIFPKETIAKGVLVLLAASHVIYLAVIGLILCIGWLSLAYVELSKPELVRYKSLQMPSIVFILLMIVSWAFVYITFRGLYLTG